MDLVIDLGQSGTRVKMGNSISSFEIAKNSTESVTETLERIFLKIPNVSIENAYLSLTGLQGDVRDPRPYGELCRRYFGSKNVCVMDDGIASYFGALGEREGIVLTLGGGVVAIASNESHFGHADGKGPLFGDFGGGFWLGQSAMRLVIATLDERGSAHDLVALLENEINDYQKLSNRSGVEAAQLCISAAKSVAVGAENGVASAIKILEEGALHLAVTIQGAWKKVSAGNKVPFLSIRGGLSNSFFYVELIKQKTSKFMDFEYVVGEGDHLTGAPKAAAKYTEDVNPLLKWWRA